MLARRLLVAAGGGAAFQPPAGGTDTVRGTSVFRTTDWSTGANNNVVPFDTEEYDDDNIWASGDPTKLGPMPASYDGKRAVFYATAIWVGQSPGSNYREIKLFRNGDTSEPIAVVQLSPNAFNTGLELTSRPIVLATGDYFECCLRSVNDDTALYAENYSISFSVEVRGV